MNEEAERLRIAARWGYRSYQSEAGMRYGLFRDLLDDMYANSRTPLLMMALESWDVTKKNFAARFDLNTPVLYTDNAYVEVFRMISFIRAANDFAASVDPQWRLNHSLSFMHFILGNATRKHGFIVDLEGSAGIQEHDIEVWSPAEDANTPESAPRISPPFVHVRLPLNRLQDLRSKHGHLSDKILRVLPRIDPQMEAATPGKPGFADLSKVAAIGSFRFDGTAVPKNGDASDIPPLLRKLHGEIDRDLARSTVAMKLARQVSQRSDLTAEDSLVGRATAFLRQAFLQAVLVPSIGGCPAVVVLPDMPHAISSSRKDLESDAPGAVEASSLAVQFFPRGNLRPEDPDLNFWATLISIVGRGKTIHDYSALERELGKYEGALAERLRIASFLHTVSHHDLRNLDAQVGGAISNLINSWDRTPDAKKKIRMKEIRANARLAFMGAGLDGLWAGPDTRLERETLSALKRALQPAVEFRRKIVVFRGDWDAEAPVPAVLKLVFANLIRNAVNVAVNREIVLEATVAPDAVEFVCRSAAPLGLHWIRSAFEEPLSSDPPSRHRGLWICRRIVVDMCRGEWSLGEESNEFRTNIRVRIPLISRRDQK